MDRLYLVTGAAGHLGSTIVRELASQGASVRALVLPTDRAEALQSVSVDLYQGDVTVPDSLSAFFDVPEPDNTVVIHCAGIVSITSAVNPVLYRVNVEGTRNVCDMCLAQDIGRLVYVSSVHAIPEAAHGQTIVETQDFSPENVVGAYAKTKAEASRYVLLAVREKGLKALVVHPSGIIGPGDYGTAHMTQMITDYMNNRLTAIVRGGYDFVDVRDVAAGILSAAASGQNGECYILSNRYYEIREIMDELHMITGHRKIRTVMPLWFVRLTAPLSEIYYKVRRKPPLYTSYSIYTLFSNSRFSHDKADRELAYRTRSLRETLSDTVEWMNEHNRISVRNGKA
jgi:dihydroflavonol-4-reductase